MPRRGGSACFPSIARRPGEADEKVEKQQRYAEQLGEDDGTHGPHSTRNGCKLLVLWTERTLREAADLSDFIVATKAVA